MTDRKNGYFLTLTLHLNVVQRDWSFKAEYTQAKVEQDVGVLVTDNSHIGNMMIRNMVNNLNTQKCSAQLLL